MRQLTYCWKETYLKSLPEKFKGKVNYKQIIEGCLFQSGFHEEDDGFEEFGVQIFTVD